MVRGCKFLPGISLGSHALAGEIRAPPEIQSRGRECAANLSAMSDAFDFQWQMALINLLRMTLAFLLAFPLAWERVRAHRNVVVLAIANVLLLRTLTPLKAQPGRERRVAFTRPRLRFVSAASTLCVTLAA